MNNALPFLTTERLLLEPPDTAYAQDVFEYSRDREFCAHIDAEPASKIEDSVRFIQGLIDDNDRGKRMYWMVFDKSGHHAVGTMGFILHGAIKHNVAEFGYGLSPNYWGKGYFQEAANAVMKCGFEKLGFRRLQAITREDNIRSIKGVQKIGFTPEAVLESYYQTSQGRINAVILRLTSEEYMKQQKKTSEDVYYE